jgi:hypothetical protein
MPDVEFVFPLKLVDKSTGIVMDIEASEVTKPITKDGSFELTWTVRNNLDQTKVVTVKVGVVLPPTMPPYVVTYSLELPPKSTYTHGPDLFPFITSHWFMEIVDYQRIDFYLSPSYFIVFSNPQMVKKFTIESSVPWSFQGLPYWIAYPSSPVQTPTLTCKLGWVKVGGVEYKGWGGAWYMDGVFKPNPVTVTVDHNITAEVHPGAFSPFIPLEDINLDGYVNVKDAIILGVAFGSKLGDPNYNPNADLNGDGYINVKDAIPLGQAFLSRNEPPPRAVTLYEARAAVSAMASQAIAGAAATAVGAILAETARKIMREVKK